MKLNPGIKRAAVCLAISCGLLAAAIVFWFGLIGYGFTAIMLAGLGVLFAAYAVLFALEAVHPKGVKRVRRIMGILIAAALLIVIAVEIPIIMAARSDEDAQADYLIVLGAGVNGTEPSLSLAERLETALKYLEKHPGATAIVSGGRGEGEDISEAEAMFKWLTGRGIDPARVIMENRATSTKENIRFSLDIIEARGGDPGGKIAIATSEYHLYRAKKIASDMGAEARGVAALTSYPVLRANYFLREAFAVMELWVFGAGA